MNKKKKIPLIKPLFEGNEKKYLEDCINSGWISQMGDYVRRFEERFAEYCGVKYAVSNSSCTAALHLALTALDIHDGDEVIIPDLSFISTMNVILYNRAVPIFIDVDRRTWNINPDDIEIKITRNTKAILPVHLYGHPCDMDRINEIARNHDLYVIDDCAQAHGSEYKGRKIGSFTNISCFSFGGNKTITAGEGGMCLTNNKRLKERMEILKNYGMSKRKKYFYTHLGFNYKITNLQAAVGLAQLERIEKKIEKKREIAREYNSHFEGIDGILIPAEEKGCKNVYWLYNIILDDQKKRDPLIRYLNSINIESRPFFRPLSSMPYNRRPSLANANYLSKRGISLPSGLDLTKDDINYISNIILNFLGKDKSNRS